MELIEEREEPEFAPHNEKKCKPGSISLCMIVKDEEYNLPRCLDSIKDVVDEIILVDTGSTDRTIEIAKSYGARVFIHPWEGNFSKARNYSLDYATCEWILIIDADEELQASDATELRETIKSNGYSAVSFVIKNKYKNSTQEGYAKMVRLFKNFNGVHYEGTVHNVLKSNGKCLESPLSIIHHGYDLSEDKMQEKFERTASLLKEQIKKDPENPVPYMYLGIAYMDRNMHDDAIANSKRALCLAEEKGFNIRDFMVSFYIISAAYFENGKFKESETYALRAVELDNQFLDGYCILSFDYYNLKEYDRFIQASENYLAIWNSITNSFSVNGKPSIHPLSPPLLKEGLCGNLENEETRPPWRREGLKSDFQSNLIYHTIGHKWKIHLMRGFYYLSNSQDQKGNFEIDIAVRKSTDMEDCLMLLGNFYMENNYIGKAEDTLMQLLSINEKSVNTLFKLGHIKFQKGGVNEAIVFWKKAVEIEPASFDIRLLICKINIDRGNFEDAIADCNQLLQILNIPEDLTLESLTDLANLFNSISERLKEIDDVQSAETASRICDDLKQISKNAPIHHGNE